MHLMILSALAGLASAAPALNPATGEALVQAYEAAFLPGVAAPVVDADQIAAARGFSCLTELLLRMDAAWPLLSPEQQARVDTRRLRPHLPATPPPAAAAVSTCYGYFSESDSFLYGDHFVIEYNGHATEEMATDFLASLEFSWDTEIEELGWQEPIGTPQYAILAYIDGTSNYAGAYTTVSKCSGVGYVPYIVSGYGSFTTSGDWYKTMACHEFNHASQFSYGYGHEFFWWEATATYAEEYVYPAYNDWADMTYVYSLVPYIGMNAFADSNSNDQYLFYHTYSMAVWAFFLDQHVGGHDLIKATWENWTIGNGYYDVWMPDLIDNLGEDFDTIYPQYLAVLSKSDFDDSRYFNDPELTDEISKLPADGGGGRSSYPQSLGQNFVRFDAKGGDKGMTLRVSFQGDEGPDRWVVVLASGDGEVDLAVTFELDGDFAGTAEIPFEGDADVDMIVSPILEDASGYYYDWERPDDWDYSWEAELVDLDAEVGGGDDTGTGTGTDDTGGVAEEPGQIEPGGCACSSGGRAAGIGAWGLLGLLGLAVRRRS